MPGSATDWTRSRRLLRRMLIVCCVHRQCGCLVLTREYAVHRAWPPNDHGSLPLSWQARTFGCRFLKQLRDRTPGQERPSTKGADFA